MSGGRAVQQQSARATALDGVVERIVYRNDENGFVVARFRLTAGRRQLRQITITGTLPGIAAGQPATVAGAWLDDRRYGATFRVSTFEPHAPTDAEGVRRFLGAGLLPGVGPVTAARIVAVFGDKALEVLDQSPNVLTQVKGITVRRAQAIAASWAEQRQTRELALFLQQHDVSPLLAQRIQAEYGAAALATVRANPYQLAQDVDGIGFKTADAIARKLGLPEQSPERTAAALRHVLSLAADDGHCFLPPTELIALAAQVLQAATEDVEAAIRPARADGLVSGEDDALYLPALYVCETGLARRLHLLQRTSRPVVLRQADVDILSAAAAATGVLLTDEQRDAVSLALRQPVSILTGGPGSGKTTALRALIGVLERQGVQYCLAAPTGRAARRLAEATGRPATTLHRLLDYAPATKEFRHCADRPLPYQFVVIDEVSMLDVVLAYHLGQALAPQAQLLLVGDVDQLPSVGPGNVLRDLIASGALPVARLSALFRQAEDSHIAASARRILAGDVPNVGAEARDFYVVEEARPERAMADVIRLVQERIPARFGLDPFTDVQVLCPMARGGAGTSALNKELQRALNARRLGQSLTWGGQQFALGDKVMQTRNNYDRNVFNGDIGVVVGIDDEAQTVHIEFETVGGRTLTSYDLRDLDELQLAYAATVHKAQGSEYPAVVLLLLPQHGSLLRRDLLYTAVTRARQLCVIVGSKAAVARAVATSDPEARNTRLGARLQALAFSDRAEKAMGPGPFDRMLMATDGPRGGQV